MELFLLLLILCVLVTAADGNSQVVVTEDSDVVLPCSLSSKENLESKLFDWKKDAGKDEEKRVFMYDRGGYSGKDFADQDKQFEGRVSHFPRELKEGNASIKITKTKVSDSGSYSCIFPNLQPSQKFSVQLVVECILKDRRGEKGSVACRKPSTKQIKATNDQAVLQCVVEGASPKPEVEWRDSSGNILQAEKTKDENITGRYDIILQTTVTKSDNYSCVAIQKEICHRVPDYFLVHLPDIRPIVTGLQTEGGLLLQCEVHGVSSGVKVELKDSSGGTIPAVKSLSPGRGGSFDIILQTTVTKSDTYSCEVTSETNQTFSTQTDGTLRDPAPEPSGSSAGWIVAGILAVVLVLGLGVWGYSHFKKKQKNRSAMKHAKDTKMTPILSNGGEKDETSAGHSNSGQPLNGQDGSC